MTSRTTSIPTPAAPQDAPGIPALLLRLLWCLLVLLLPFRWNYATGYQEMAAYPMDLWQWLFFTFQPHFLLATLAGALLLASLALHRRLPPLSPSLAIPLLTLLPLLAGLAGCHNTTETAYAIRWLWHFFTISLVAWGVWWTAQHDAKLLPWLGVSLALGGLLAAFQGWTQHFGGLEETLRLQQEYARSTGQPLTELMEAKMRQTRSLGSFGDPNAYGAQLLLACPFLFWGALQLGKRCASPKAASWLLGGGAALLSGGALLFSGSRGAILGALAGGLLAALAAWGDRLSRRGVLILLLAAMLAGGGMTLLLNHLSHRKMETVTVRLEYYGTAWQIFQRHPWTGAGLGEFFPWHLRLKGWEGDEARDAHSLFFAQLAQCGIPGAAESLLRLLAPLLLTLWLLRKRTAPLPGLAIAALGAWGAWTAHGMVQFNDMVVSSATLAGFLGLLAFSGTAPPPAARPVPRLLPWALALLGLFALTSLCQAPAEKAFQEAEDALARPGVPYASQKALLEKAMDRSPRLPAPAQTLADLALSREDFPTARRALERLQATSPHRASTAYRLWRLALLEGDLPAAEEHLQRLYLWNPTSLRWWLAYALKEKGVTLAPAQLVRLVSLPQEKKSVTGEEILVEITLSRPATRQQDALLLAPLREGIVESLSHRTLKFQCRTP
ncbi:MAG: O-antigen ligase family protein [Oligosphaeraceae bacterium]